MKKTYVAGLVLSLLVSPGITLAQTVDSTQLVVEPTVVETSTIGADSAPEPMLTSEPVAEPTLISEPVIVISENPIVVTLKPVVAVENPALDVSYCGKRFIYSSGTYDTENKPVKAPVCTVYDVRYASYATVDFGKSDDLPVHHFEVHNDGKLVFTDKMKMNELTNRIIRGETDSKYYLVSGNEQHQEITSYPEESVKLLFADDTKEGVVYFDDSIVYSYQLTK